MDQVQALVTATIQQMGGTLEEELKNVKSGNDKRDFTAGVKVEVQRLKDDRRAKVLEHIQLVISTATLRGFGHAFDAAIAYDLPVKHSDKDGGKCHTPGFNFVNSQGLAYEAAEVNRCLHEGLIETPFFSTAQCIEVLQIISDIREYASKEMC